MRAASLAALAGALLALVGSPGAARAAAERVEVRAAPHPDFGRLVLEWPAPIAVESHQDGERLTLGFARPFAADLADLPEVLGGYLVGVAAAADGRSVALQLAPGIAARLDVDDDRIVIVDLAPGVGASGPVGLRTGVHDGFLRIVLDWPRPIGFAAEADGRRLRIRFDQEAPIDAALIRARCLALLDGATAGAADGWSELSLLLKAGVRAEVFDIEGRQVVVDLYEPAGAPPAPAAPAILAASAPRPPRPTPPGPAAPNAAPAELPEPAAAPPEAETPPLALELATAEVEGGAALDFVWNRPTAAAFLLRAGYLWSVFAPVSAQVDPPLLPSLASPVPAWLGPAELVDAAGGTALRFPLRRPLAARVERAGDRWRVVLSSAAAPPEPVPIERLAGPPRLRIVTGEAARIVAATDPEVGDRLEFWPLPTPGRGQPQPQRLVELELLATAQGIAWRAQTDQLRAAAVEGAIELQAPEGLRLSAGAMTASPPADAPAGPEARAPVEVVPAQVVPAEVVRADEAQPAGSATGTPESAPPAGPDRAAPPTGDQPAPDLPPGASSAAPRPLDLARLAPADRATLADRRVLLQQQLLGAAAEDRQEARLELARFLLAHGLAAEALATLRVIGAPDAAADGPLQLARQGLTGAAQLLMGRLDEAATGLEAPALDADPEIALWRAALAAARNDWPRAAGELVRSERILDRYPEALQLRLGLPAVRIAIEAGHQDEATRLLGRLNALRLLPRERDRVAFLGALAQARRGAIDDADRIWTSLAPSRDDPTRIAAGYARAEMLLDAGRLTAAEALARLVAARPRWRPHPQELAMLDGLARLYLRTGDPASALHTWREVLSHFPAAPETERVAKAMRDGFVAALLPADGVGIGALRAYALYRDFPELVPDGDLGDRLSRRLAAGLAGLDLVRPAAALLEPLVERRLSGPAKAEAGAYLAELWLREPDPDAALAALDRSRIEGELPRGLDVQRRVLRAQALAAANQPAAALAVLADGADLAQRRLRAEILWQQRDWPRLIGALEDLLPAPPDPEEPLAGAEQDLVIKLALAYARLGDARALERLRARFADAMRGEAGGPAFLMATLPPGRAAGSEAGLARADEYVDRVRAYLESVRPSR